MKIYVLGSGNIGGTLGGKWAARGHEVVFGVRDPEAGKVQALLAQVGHGASAVFSGTAVPDVDVVLFALPARTLPDLVVPMADYLNGKILIDATNNVDSTPMHQLDLLRQTAPDSPLFRAFSNLGWENFAQPTLAGQQVDLFYCGDEGAGQTAVHNLIADIPLRPIYIGDNQQADTVDSLTRLWFTLAYQQGYGRRLAFKMLTEGTS